MNDVTYLNRDLASPDDLVRYYVIGFLAGYSSDNTRLAYEGDLRCWFDWCRSRQVSLVKADRPHVDMYMRQLELNGLASSTRGRRLGTLKKFYEYLADDDVIEKNPAKKVQAPRVTRTPQPSLNRVQLQMLIDVAEASRGYRWPLIALLFVNGLRISEACSSDVGDYGTDRYHRTLSIVGKGNKPDVIPLPPVVSAAVTRHLNDRGRPSPDEPLLVSDRGNRVTRTTATGQLERLCKKAGVPPISPHGLRRSVIQVLLRDGVSIRDVQLFARHADPATTIGYDEGVKSMDAHASYAVMRAMS